ncbi:MAG: hypothetical protein D6B27_12030, partial [Gammaproteobacteria bacterium]
MKLRVTDKSGFVCDEKDVEISNNKYCGSYRIPYEAEDSIKLEVEIEEYGLKGETKDLLVIKDVSLNIVNNEPKAENNPYSASAYRIKTDTGDTRIGKIKGNKVFAEKVHYIQEYSLEILTDEELKEITQYTNYVKQYYDTVDANISNSIKKIDEIKLGETGTATSATTTAETPTATDSQNTTASNTATETAANNTTSKTET